MKYTTRHTRRLLGSFLAVLLVLFVGAGAAFAQEGGAPAENVEKAQKAETAEREKVEKEKAERVEKAEAGGEAAPNRPTLEQTSLASQERTLPGGTLALAAYIVLWVLVFGFIFVVMRRQRALNRELESLEQRMDEVVADLQHTD